ncbi:energy transducer TonB [Hanstruepera ponticola]|uniref:energy transducer TonB n=1 Tax=Hanstruepera ponticola TaxID=2042995 RepID=UPI000CF0AA7D|nr:energy transducer TonB [Hanstruepera ponticola]
MKIKLIFLAFFLFLNTLFSQNNNQQDNTIETGIEDIEKLDRVPIYPGCDNNMGNQALKECMNEMLVNHVKSNFNLNAVKNIGLNNGTYQIRVFFKIDTVGNISDMIIKGESPKANKEAKRVMDLLPKLEPGTIDGKPVRVPYFLPIKFKVDNENDLKTRFPIYRGCKESINNVALKECTTQKIMDYIKVSINYELADKLFPLDKTTQFLVSFTINKKGKLENITAKAHKREMAAEAINVLKRMPKLKSPGYKNGKPINTDMEILMTIYF